MEAAQRSWTRRIYAPVLVSVAAHAVGLLAIGHFDARAHQARPAQSPLELSEQEFTVESDARIQQPQTTTVEVVLLSPNAGSAASRPQRNADATVAAGIARSDIAPRSATAQTSRRSIDSGFGNSSELRTSTPEVTKPNRDQPRTPSPGELARRLVGRDVPARSRSPRSPLDAPRRRRPARARGEITPDGNGAYRATDTTFNAAISRDGRVTFKDKPNFNVHLRIPGPKTIARHLQKWSEDPYGVAATDERAIETHTVPLVGGGFDLTDWAMRASGGDPYYHRKKNFFDRTRKQRAAMATREKTEALRDSIANLKRHLDNVWSYRAWPSGRRRAALFQLWDECAESDGTDATEVALAGTRARKTIEAFIRRRLPMGSANGFSLRELADLNAKRTSAQTFAPYRGESGD